MTEAEIEAGRRARLRDLLEDDDESCFCYVSSPCPLHEYMTVKEDEAYAKGGAYAVLKLLDEADEAEAEAAEAALDLGLELAAEPVKPRPGLDTLPEVTRERVYRYLSAMAVGSASGYTSADTLLAPSLPDLLDGLDNLLARAEAAEAQRDFVQGEAEVWKVQVRDMTREMMAWGEAQAELRRKQARLDTLLREGPKLPPLPEPTPAPAPAEGPSLYPLGFVVAVGIMLITVLLLVFVL